MTLDRIERWFEERLVPAAEKGLPGMFLPGRDLFCFKAEGGGGGELRLRGESPRYSAMVLIGAQALEGAREEWEGIPLRRVRKALLEWARGGAEPGDLGLVLLALLGGGGEGVEETLERILADRGSFLDRGKGFTTMEMGWLLWGLAAAWRAGAGGGSLEETALALGERLLSCQRERAGLFSFGADLRRKNLHAALRDRRLGSFASQVYPILGLAELARASGERGFAAAAVRCADRVRALQGPQGQWWWIYHAGKGRVALKYPVYSVHQDSMGPMALLAAGGAEEYGEAVLAGLEWFDGRPEVPGPSLVDPEKGFIVRAVQRDDPDSTGKLGLGKGELRRLALAAWTGREDRRPAGRLVLCPECRPYHLGWILYARALLAREREKVRSSPDPDPGPRLP